MKDYEEIEVWVSSKFADEDVGSETGGLPGQLAFETHEAAEHGGEDELPQQAQSQRLYDRRIEPIRHARPFPGPAPSRSAAPSAAAPVSSSQRPPGGNATGSRLRRDNRPRRSTGAPRQSGTPGDRPTQHLSRPKRNRRE